MVRPAGGEAVIVAILDKANIFANEVDGISCVVGRSERTYEKEEGTQDWLMMGWHAWACEW